jgi:O-antigen/teichoic acid export membrane protein
MLWANICNFFSQNMVSIITGRYIGVETLGSFNIAYNLAIVPAQKIQKVLTSVLAPAFADVSGDQVAFGRRIYGTLFSLGAVFIPMMAGLALVANELVTLIYGPKWVEAASILSTLAFVGLMRGIQHYFNSVIIARGNGAAAISRITTIETLAGLPIFYVGATLFGMQGLVGAYVLATGLAFVLGARMSERIAGEGGTVVTAISRSILAAVAMAVAVSICGNLTGGALLVMAVKVTVGATVYVAVRFLMLTETERSIVRRWPGGGLVLQKG